MSAPWPIVSLHEVIEHRKNFIIIDDLKTYRRPRVQLHAQGIVLRDVIPGALIKTKKQQVIHAGDFLVAEIDAKVGGFGIVPDELHGAIVSSHYFLYDHCTDRLDNRYLGWFLKTHQFRKQIEAQGSTNYAAIRPADVLGYEIPLPPVDEQGRIVARIEELTAKVEEAICLRSTAIEETNRLLAAKMLMIFNFEDAKTTIGNFAKVQGGFAFPSNEYDSSGTHQVVRIGNVRDGYLDLTRAPVRWNPSGDARVLKYELQENDLIISMTGTRDKRDYGFVARVPGQLRLLLNQRVGRIVVHSEIDRDYLFHFLRSPFFRDHLFPSATGTANQANIGNGDIERIRFAPPKIHEQRRIASELANIASRVDVLRQMQLDTVAQIDALTPAILDMAFKGEL
jgi:type I restriction enzyme S subunit